MARTLQLTVISYGDEPRSGLSRSFGPGRYTIGRSAGSDWVLDDPEKHLSNRHCVIEEHDGQYSITDFSTNGVFVNGAEQALGHGCSFPLDDGDCVVIGDYQIAVGIERQSLEAASPAPVFGELDPFSSGSVGGRATGDAFVARNDPVVLPKPAPGGEVEWPGDRSLGPQLGSFPPAAALQAGVTPFDPGHVGGPDPNHVPAVNSFFRVPEIKPPIIPLDWNALPTEAAPPSSESGEVALPSAPSGESRSAPIATAEPAITGLPAGTRPFEARLAPSIGGGVEEALRAFLEGAGFRDPEVRSVDAEARLRAYGALFHELASGVRELLATRALMKSEFRIPQTMIRASGNNPLKFSVDLEQAIQALLAPKNTGYAEPLAAVREAIEDLKAHELGVIAGMQKAVARLLSALAPETLERRIEATGLLASLVPAARKARYWEAYATVYREVAADLEEDVQGAFRRSFATAYSEQVKKL